MGQAASKGLRSSSGCGFQMWGLVSESGQKEIVCLATTQEDSKIYEAQGPSTDV